MPDRDSPIARTEDAGLLTLRMNRRHGNAINPELVEGMIDALTEARANPAVRGVLLASSGKIFCPGLDLLELRSYDRATLERFLGRLSDCWNALFTFPKPLVAAISGHALAGGCVLALTADRRVLRWGALVGLNEVRVGLPLPFDVALVLREAVHPRHLADVALLGSNFTDEAAVAAGLVHEVHEADGFEPYCLSRLEEYASRDARAFALTKGYLRSEVVERVRAARNAYIPDFLDTWFSASTQAAIQRVVEDLESRRS